MAPGKTFWTASRICIATILVSIVLAIQLVRPSLLNPPVTADLQASPAVKEILKNSCYNCHSNETHLWWYDLPVPAYWLVVDDVRSGRKRLNFSEIGKLSPGEQKAALYESVNQIQFGEMPPSQYTIVHHDAIITPAQLVVLKEYLHPAAVPQSPVTTSPEEIAAADAEYENWISSGSPAKDVQPALNGLAFFPDYKNWKAISSTDRFDNNTIRQILGNDIAIQAIANNQINPWPDGTAFAKVAWTQQQDEKGVVRPGKFFQVEFMIRDSKKYSRTLGWGFGRWRGVDLRPYGKDANFARECVRCHEPLSNTNYVFTAPIRGQQ
jgi:Haem-binding domain/Cytochrome P460